MKTGLNLNHEELEKYQSYAEEHLGFRFNDIGLLVTALTHRSYVNEHRKIHIEHNERLEFLGDAVLELVVSDYLFRNFNLPEGVMTALRSSLVRTEANSLAGQNLGYDSLIRLSHGEKAGSERAHAVILADCFEAVIGAVYIDQGESAARDLIYKFTISKLPQILEDESWRDAKSYFQELVQHFYNAIPTYHTLSVDGPDHCREYTIGLYVGETKIAEAKGPSKQEAQTICAREGIRQYKAKGMSLPIAGMNEKH